MRGPRSTPRSYPGRAVGTVQVGQAGSYLLRTEGAPQVVPAHVAVGEEVGSNLGLRAIPIVLLLLFGGQSWRWSSRSAASRHAGDRRRWPPRAQGALPASWLADPGMRHELRYWDGQRWTEHVSDRGTRRRPPRPARRGSLGPARCRRTPAAPAGRRLHGLVQVPVRPTAQAAALAVDPGTLGQDRLVGRQLLGDVGIAVHIGDPPPVGALHPEAQQLVGERLAAQRVWAVPSVGTGHGGPAGQGSSPPHAMEESTIQIVAFVEHVMPGVLGQSGPPSARPFDIPKADGGAASHLDTRVLTSLRIGRQRSGLMVAGGRPRVDHRRRRSGSRPSTPRSAGRPRAPTTGPAHGRAPLRRGDIRPRRAGRSQGSCA
jgi:hypothetical protein